MGYTNYWKFTDNPKNIENGAEKFKNAVNAAKDCIGRVTRITVTDYVWDSEAQKSIEKKRRITLRLGNGIGRDKPIFRDDMICFNGLAAKGQNYETFSINLDDDGFDFNFCKTARQPYDVAVCIALLCFKHYFGDDFSYRSDGDIEKGEEGWKQAKKITADYFQYK